MVRSDPNIELLKMHCEFIMLNDVTSQDLTKKSYWVRVRVIDLALICALGGTGTV